MAKRNDIRTIQLPDKIKDPRETKLGELIPFKRPNSARPEQLKYLEDYRAVVQMFDDSMRPTYQTGDLIVIDTRVNQFFCDDVYCYTDPSFPEGCGLFILRLQSLGKTFRIIRDNKQYKKFTINRDELERWIFHGRVIGAWQFRIC